MKSIGGVNGAEAGRGDLIDLRRACGVNEVNGLGCRWGLWMSRS